jgi:ubiquinone/menaquinone biosynthesis C-methylase UbiE
MSQDAKFWDKSAKGYAKSSIGDEEAYQRKLADTRKYLKPEMNVLEMACGTGTTAIAHAPYVKHILAMDISQEMLNFAKSKADEAGVENISFACSDLENFEVAESSLDVVMAHSILHLLPEPEMAIEKAFKILKPGGYFVSNTACIADASFIWRLVLPVVRFLRLAPFVKVLTREELDAKISAAGFEIEHQWPPYKKMTAFIIAKKRM